MKVIPLAADSLGVRSMACLVKTPDITIVIDPAAALGGLRFGLKPAPIEKLELKRQRSKIRKAAEQADIIVISHYHWDHFDPQAVFMKGKKVFLKDYQKNINKSQRKRANKYLAKKWHVSRYVAQNHIVADGKTFQFGKTRIVFSPAVRHGEKQNRLGYVIMTTVQHGGKTFTHASDVAGPGTLKAMNQIIKMKPDLLYIDGPPTLFLGWKYSYKNLALAKKYLLEILKKCKCTMILDHHLLRDEHYRKNMLEVLANKKVKTAAEFLGKKNSFLEFQRKELWQKFRKKS